MHPAPGERLQRFVGDGLRFELNLSGAARPVPPGWRARLRTNLGRAEMLRREIIEGHAQGLRLAGASWRDLPMPLDGAGWSLNLPLAEAGFFRAKAYLLDPKGWQHWPDGPDVGISVHPDEYRTANLIYCAFPRMFGGGKGAASTRNETLDAQIRQIEEHGYTIIPASGKLRDLIQQLPHILDGLGCRILHLLPVNPVPTTYGRFGRFGSPYAAQDLTAIDPALVVFDRRTTGVDQFRELTYATHLRGGRVFLDIVINHTGWGSRLQENHPDWFLRNPDGTLASPGAWGVTWEDLIELKHDNVLLWDKLAEVFLTWCRRGVDGFRCDAGYKVPIPAWQYIVARVQQEFPETLFLLEGLGGAWETTEALLTEGGMQWAYSELFQNYSGPQVTGYLDHSIRQSGRVGLLVHYSETHDNDRLAIRGRAWSLLRNRLCALASVSGGFGFTCGAEWLATEKFDVHGSTGLAWGGRDNLLPELARLNRLVAGHPCFFDGATLTRLNPPDSPVYALLRRSAEGRDMVLVLVNDDPDRPQSLALDLTSIFREPQAVTWHELLGQSPPKPELQMSREVRFTLPPGGAYCLSPSAQPLGLSGESYRRARARAAWAIESLSRHLSAGDIGRFDWRALADLVDRSPFDFLATIQRLDPPNPETDLLAALAKASASNSFPRVVCWSLPDRRRITPVPPGHWLLVRDTVPFRASLEREPGQGETPNDRRPLRARSIAVSSGHIACFPPGQDEGDARVRLERYEGADRNVEAALRFLAPEPGRPASGFPPPTSDSLVLLTNGIGGMARIRVDLGRVKSKYDCVLGANLHPAVPVDRHVFAKRIRVWVDADGFLSPLDLKNLAAFESGPPAVWHFVANAGDGRTVEIEMQAEMIQDRNATVFRFTRPLPARAAGKPLPADAGVSLTVRLDIEDRNFHWETRRTGGAEYHFSAHTSEIRNLESETPNPVGFAFTPAAGRQLRVFASAGEYHRQPEWSDNIPHPIEASRGQTASGDAYSPGWFDLPLPAGAKVTLTVTADAADAGGAEFADFKLQTEREEHVFETRLRQAVSAFVVRRGKGKTVIAGYPWFLDWGRDTFICARGLLAAGLVEDVKRILVTFARFEQDGTFPNTIHGEDASNRDTSDAPLWFAVVCEDLAEMTRGAGDAEEEEDAHAGSGMVVPDGLYAIPVGSAGRALRDVLRNIAAGYAKGTPNGIRMDPESGLIWSPAHFTWMDTNHPAGTPREGYPVEIQALWIRLLRQLARVCEPRERRRWSGLADTALAALEKLFWLEERGFYADVLLANAGQPATRATASDALRSNGLFPVSLGVVGGPRARRQVEAAQRHLLVPGGLRSLAPLPVSVPLPVHGNDGRLLNNPAEPYWGRYEGDEDRRRKPAYHNGTAWTWTLPIFCEALARAWDFGPDAVAAARAWLGSAERSLNEGCLGQIPEVLDGDAPHGQRGCDAQAWGVTETLRVWKLLQTSTAGS
jgi:starch synthase (maltosyl-transferring)